MNTSVFVYEGHWVKVKVTGAKKVKKSLLPQCKTLIGHKSASVKHTAMRCACVSWLWRIIVTWPKVSMHNWMIRRQSRFTSCSWRLRWVSNSTVYTQSIVTVRVCVCVCVLRRLSVDPCACHHLWFTCSDNSNSNPSWHHGCRSSTVRPSDSVWASVSVCRLCSLPHCSTAACLSHAHLAALRTCH